jgi:hypothetical protein
MAVDPQLANTLGRSPTHSVILPVLLSLLKLQRFSKWQGFQRRARLVRRQAALTAGT